MESALHKVNALSVSAIVIYNVDLLLHKTLRLLKGGAVTPPCLHIKDSS